MGAVNTPSFWRFYGVSIPARFDWELRRNSSSYPLFKFQFLQGSIGSCPSFYYFIEVTVSIPARFDWEKGTTWYVWVIITFQFLQGSIGSNTEIFLFSDCAGFNSCKVRLGAGLGYLLRTYFCCFNSCKVRLGGSSGNWTTDHRDLFQFLQGSIGSAKDAPRGGNENISFNSCKVRLGVRQQGPLRSCKMVSIPVRFDWEEVMNICIYSMHHVSIPVRFDWEHMSRIFADTPECFNSCKVRLGGCTNTFKRKFEEQFQFL